VFELDESDDGQRRRCHFGMNDETKEVVVTRSLPLATMTKSEAIRLCIAKWEVIVLLCEEGFRIESEGGHNTCALCHMFLNKGNNSCDKPFGKKCPISVATGRDMCHGTPYRSFTRADRDDLDARMEEAVREVTFLRGLLELAVEEERG